VEETADSAREMAALLEALAVDAGRAQPEAEEALPALEQLGMRR